MQSTNKAVIYGSVLRNFASRLIVKAKMIRQYAPVRNKILARNGILVLAGFLAANGFIGIGIFLIFVGTVIDEL
jgi:hypothetical protein